MVSLAFSALCVYSKFGHHPRPLGYFVPNFVSFAASTDELAHGEKSHTPTQSLTHPAYLMPREPKLALRKTLLKVRLRLDNSIRCVIVSNGYGICWIAVVILAHTSPAYLNISPKGAIKAVIRCHQSIMQATPNCRVVGTSVRNSSHIFNLFFAVHFLSGLLC